MLLNYKYLVFLPSLMLGSLLALSSSSWVSAWFGLEINLMSMAPILINKTSNKSIEATLKYFLVQALASTLLIFFLLLFSDTHLLYLPDIWNTMISATLILKTGMAPFQFWFPQVMAYSDWPQCFLLLSWQKVAPFSLLSLTNSPLILFAILSSALVGAMGGFNQFNFSLILTYSSILHSAWMLGLLNFCSSFWLTYLGLYSLINLAVISPFFLLSGPLAISLQLPSSASGLPSVFVGNMFSLAGLPPLLGFAIKFISVCVLFSLNVSLPLLASLISASFTSFYYYLRMILLSLFNFSWITLHMQLIHFNSTSFPLYSSLSFLGNFVAPLVILLA